VSNEYRDFIFQRNMERFSQLLAIEKDQKKRATLSQLLREERAKRDKSSLHSEN
ncbi:unnamed protein product, partial [Laminaria digitata]